MVKPRLTKETPYPFNISRGWQPLNYLHLSSIHLNTPNRHDIPKNNPLLDHKVTFLSIQNQVNFLASTEHLNQVCQTHIKCSSIDQEVIHKDFHNVFHVLSENGKHAPSESSGGIAQAKRHPPAHKGTVRACECRALLIARVDRDLEEIKYPSK